jgi:hypothetical protein
MLAVAESLREMFPGKCLRGIQFFDPVMAVADDIAKASHPALL